MAPSQPEISLVMVIDDHIEEIAKIESLVSAEVPGCVFLRETSIKKALEDLRTKQPKLVVMEAHLKDGDASELLQAFPHKDRSFPCLIIRCLSSEPMIYWSNLWMS
jgi:DNA-binding NarL/FixJ family response regulator